MYHVALVLPSFWERLLELDVEIAGAFISAAVCLRCGGRAFSRHDYRRKPRGFPQELSWDKLEQWFSLRISFRCDVCRKRVTPPSVRFLGRKVYIGSCVLWASRCFERGEAAASALSLLKEIKDELGDFLPARTVRRWLQWWQGPVWQSSFWRAHHGQLTIGIERGGFLRGVWRHFSSVLSAKHSAAEDTIITGIVHAILQFFSPLTHPPSYPF